jgi:hypothetical protein
MRSLLARVAGFCVARPAPVLAAVATLALLGTVAALRLQPDAGTDQLVDRGSEAYEATAEFKRRFGDDAVVVLVEGDLKKLVLTSDLGTLLGLEGCLSGNAPGGEVFVDEPAPAPCAALAESKPARVVYGPATFLNSFAEQAGKLLREQLAAAQEQARDAYLREAAAAARRGLSEAVQQQLGRAAAQEVLNSVINDLLTLSVRYGQAPRIPTIDDPQFVEAVVFDPREAGQPKPRFSYLYPSAESALISIRLRPELSESERGEAIDQIRAAVADPAFRIRDASYVVSGVPVVVDGVAAELSAKIFLLLAVALAAMAVTLALLFAPPLRLLPLATALATVAVVFGALSLVGGSLTLASLAVLPVLIGLAVDYAIQFQARFAELLAVGSSPGRAAVEAAARGGPVIATALLATAAGFCVLLVWPLPVIRSFGLLLIVGVALAFCLALVAGLTALSLAARSSGAGRWRRPAVLNPFAPVAASARGLGERARSAGKRAIALSLRAPGTVLVVALVVALAGWALGTRTDVVADIRELLPRDVAVLEEVERLEEGTGVSGEVDVMVTAPELTDPAVVAWMADYKQRVLEAAGFSSEADSCLEQTASLCPSIALPDLFSEGEGTPTQARIRRVLGLLPKYFSQAVISGDPDDGTGAAAIAFGIKVMPFDEQKQLIDMIRSELDPPGTESDPPPGVEAAVVGLPVLVADASAGLSGDRHLLTLLGLVAVALALLAAYRSLRRAFVPLIPIVLATGWSSFVVWVLGIELNPMSATLGALVIAIATEFSVLLASRYEEERGTGAAVPVALRSAYSRTGRAVLASGATAIAGFAVLIVSGIPLLRDFGLVTVLDLGVALLGVLIVLPAALVWAERGFELRGLRAGGGGSGEPARTPAA